MSEPTVLPSGMAATNYNFTYATGGHGDGQPGLIYCPSHPNETREYGEQPDIRAFTGFKLGHVIDLS